MNTPSSLGHRRIARRTLLLVMLPTLIVGRRTAPSPMPLTGSYHFSRLAQCPEEGDLILRRNYGKQGLALVVYPCKETAADQLRLNRLP